MNALMLRYNWQQAAQIDMVLLSSTRSRELSPWRHDWLKLFLRSDEPSTRAYEKTAGQLVAHNVRS